MGWLFSHSTRTQLIASVIKPERNEYFCRETLKHCLRGNLLWVLAYHAGRTARRVAS